MINKKKYFIVPVLLLAATWGSAFSTWLGDLFSHFRIFWTFFSFVLLLLYLTFYYKKLINHKPFIFIGVTLFWSFMDFPSLWTNSQTYEYLFFGSPTSIEYSEKVKQEIENDTTVKSLLLMNILSSNTNYDEVKRTIKNTNADFVVIIELNKKWENKLKELERIYPYQFTEIREDNFGMGIYSKIKDTNAFPIYSQPTISNDTESEFVGLEATCLNYDLRLAIIHPIPPINLKAYNARNYRIDFFSKKGEEFSDEKFLLVGDFNCSPFSVDYKKFLEKSGLKDSQGNFGFQPTWHTSLPFLMQTPIDHVWHSEDIEILHRQTLPIKGSDHKAVFVVFR